MLSDVLAKLWGFLRPDWIIDGDVDQIDLDVLWAQGIRGLIFDLDNTLTPPKRCELWPEVSAWVDALHQKGFKAMILSNTHHKAHCDEAGRLFTMPAIHMAHKPHPPKFIEALEQLQLAPHQVAMVGDRPLTDIWGGAKMGMFTILVAPLTRATESPVIRFCRALERSFIHPEALSTARRDPQQAPAAVAQPEARV